MRRYWIRWASGGALLAMLVVNFFVVFANHSTLRTDPFNTNPIDTQGEPSGAYAPRLRDTLDHEQSQREGELFAAYVVTGGLHATAVALTSDAFATVARLPERVSQTATAITYGAVADDDVCWTIISSDTDDIAGWTRVGTTAYYYQCQGDAVPAIPTLPPNSAFLMQVTITDSVIAVITDRRIPGSWAKSRVYDVTDPLYGASPAAAASANVLAINQAVAAASLTKGIALIPDGIFCLDGSIIIKSNMQLKGTGMGSVLKVCTATTFHILDNNDLDIANTVIDSVGFDGSLNYPADSTIYHIGLTVQNRAINLNRILGADPGRLTNDIKNVAIRNNYFNQMNAGSIFIRGLNMEDVEISGNYGYKSSYTNKFIMVKAPSGATTSNRSKRVLVTNNRSDTNGPQYFYDPNNQFWISSTDGIEFDLVSHSVISHNVIHKAGGIGIRVENSIHIAVIGNTVTESGIDGISLYKETFAVSIVGNTVTNWGRTPLAQSMRNYGGTYVVAREFPLNPEAPLPVDPTLSSWFDVWPYSTVNILMANVITYLDTDYYTTGPGGILPYRGASGISMTSNSRRCAIVGNVITGSAELDGAGKRLYANEYGISPIHVVNNTINTAQNGDNCAVVGNTINTASRYSIYHPHFHDPINEVGVNGKATYLGNGGNSNVELVDATATNLRMSEVGAVALYADQAALPTYFITGNAGTLDPATAAGFAMSVHADRSVRGYLRMVRNGGETPMELATFQQSPLVFITDGVERMKITGTGAFRGLATTNGPVGTFTYAAASGTVISNTSVSGVSIIQLMPTNVAAGLLVRNQGLHVLSQVANTSFTVATSTGVAAAGTETFNYEIKN